MLHSEDPGSFVVLHRKSESLPHSMHSNATITKRCTIKITVKKINTMLSLKLRLYSISSNN